MYESNYNEEELGFHPLFNRPTKFTLIRGENSDYHPYFYMKVEGAITSKLKNSHKPVEWVKDISNPYIEITEEEYYKLFKEFEAEYEMNRDKEEPMVKMVPVRGTEIKKVKETKKVKELNRERDEIDEIMDSEN